MADAAGIHRELIDAANRHDLEAMRAFLADDYQVEVNGGPPGGADDMLAQAGGFFAAFPDLTFEVKDVCATGECSVVELVGTGTHQAELGGIPPTGKKVTIAIANAVTVHDGKVTSEREWFDQLGLMQQLGVIPTD